jgi:two-component system, NarL family, response regulator YdfI
VIRVLLGSRSSGVENAIRSSPSLELAGKVEFAGRVDPFHIGSSHIDPGHLSSSDLPGDVLVLEVEDHDEHDWQALADLPIPVVLLLDSADSAHIRSILRAGIRGVISLDATPQEIESAVYAVNAGLVVIPPSVFAQLLRDTQLFAEELAEPLSARELEVLDRLAEGLSNKLIAHRLNISEHTVKTHVASIFAKLGASSRTEAVSQAIRRGLVML